MKCKIGVIGSLVVDYLCSYIDEFPNLGEHIEFRNFEISTGGNGGNVAINLAKLGLNINYFSGSLGNDNNGEFLLNELLKLNINIEGIQKIKIKKQVPPL